MQGIGKDKLVKALAYMLTSNFIALAISFSASILMARMMKPEQFGTLLAAEAFVILFSFLFALGFRNSIFSISAKHEEGLVEGLNTAIGTGLFIKTVTIIPAALITYVAALLTKPSPDLLYAISCYIFIECMGSFARMFGVVRRALGEFKLISLINAANSVLRLLLIVIVLKYFGDWKLLVSLFAFFSIFKFLFSYISTIKLFKPRLDFAQVLPMLKDSLGFGLYDTVEDAQERLDRVMLSSILGSAAVAFYSVPARVNRLSKMIPATINQVFLPTLYEAYEHARPKFIKLVHHISRFFALSGALIFIAVYYFSGFVILKLFGSQYEASLEIVKIFAYATLLMFLDKAPNLVLAIQGEHGKRISSLVAAMIIFVLASLYLIPSYGISGAVYAAIIASTARFIFMFACTYKLISFVDLFLIAIVPALLAPWVSAWILIPAYLLYLWLAKLIKVDDVSLLRNAFVKRAANN